MLLLAIVLNSSVLSAQEETGLKPLELTIGDTIQFASQCDTSFKYIDICVKTRYLDTVLQFNPFTGVGFYKTFFAEGDFDVKRLPCSYAGRKFTIVSTENFTDKNTGLDRFVVFVMLDDWKQVAWIEFISAYEAGEVILE